VKIKLAFLLTLFLQQFVLGQTETYTINKASFSSNKYDEFSPVYYKNGIVFCSNHKYHLKNYSTTPDKRLVKIDYIDTTGKAKWRSARLLSRNLKTKLNDGPVTFNSRGDTIYYSRNLEVSSKLLKISNPRNKLGIFRAVLVRKKWRKISEFRFNSEWYNVTTPWLSPDGKRLFFASDKPGGFGGLDLYYCQWKGDYWNDPVNLGPIINTKGNEAYPFINPAGELFFSSDGHPGFGGMDIFFSRFSGTAWLIPVGLDAPINSQYDDFGIITDTLMNEGYFSSNRNKSIDIFHFRTNFPQIFYSSIQRENQYCFMFNDNGSIVVDTANLQYKWYFGDGKSATGVVVNHCFPGPGNYDVRLDIVERGTGKLFFTKLAYNLELRDFEQPYINSSDVAVKGDVVEFDGLKSYLPGFEILSYSWDFGDGNRLFGENVKHSYKEKGEYIVNLGLTLKSDSTGNINKTGSSKKILVLNDLQERANYLAKSSSVKPELSDIKKYNNAYIKPLYSAETEFKQDVVFQVGLISSKTKIGTNSSIFRNVPKKYVVKEIFDQDAGTYNYVIDQQMSLMSTYIAYKEIAGYGFKDAHIRLEILKDPAAKELNNIKKIFGILTDSYFDSYGRLTSNAYLLLDQIVKIMNKYPGIKLEVAVHTDNSGLPENKLIVSQRYAQTITNYLINKGIDSKRLMGVGYGGSKPIAPNYLEKDRSINRRVDFTIIKPQARV